MTMMRDLRLVIHLFLASSQMKRRRAYLTIASIAWGTVAILLLLAFGEGLKRQITKNEHAMGVNLAVMWPGETTKPYRGLPPGRSIRPRIDDIAFLRTRLPDAEAVVGEMHQWRTALTYGGRTVNGHVVGVSHDYGEVRQHIPVAGGRFLDARDEAEKRRVIFLGDELARDIFGERDPVGRTLSVNDAPYTVIGVMRHKVQMGAYGGPDESHACIPITTFAVEFGRERLGNIVVKAPKPSDMRALLRAVNEALGPRHGYDPSDDRALPAWDTVKSGHTTQNIVLGIQLFLGLIGALTLIVGGVGVANIMVAVIKERTHEIGVKMALGARARWITGSIVMEGLCYTLTGGAAGTGLALLLVTLASLVPTEGNKVMEFLGAPKLSLPIGAATAAILGAIGILAGYFPARRAARVDPATTLRYE